MTSCSDYKKDKETRHSPALAHIQATVNATHIVCHAGAWNGE